MKKISLIIPVYNEEENILPLHKSIVNSLKNIDYELIFVDDGSYDKSVEKIKSLKNNKLKLFELKKHCGKTLAWKKGFENARNEIIVTIDADLQNDPLDIPKMIDKLDEGYDFVNGYRAHRKDSFVKKISSKIANYTRKKILGDSFSDVGCGLKAFRKKCLKGAVYFEGFHRFLPTFAEMKGNKICEIEVNHHPRIHGKTKYGTFDRFFKGIRTLYIMKKLKKELGK